MKSINRISNLLLSTLLVTALVTAVITINPLPVVAQELSFTASAAGHNVQDDGIFVFSDSSVNMAVNLSLGYEVFPNLSVLGEYETGSQSGDFLSAMQMDFTLYAARFGLQYRYPLLPFLQPYVQAGVSFNWGDVDLNTTSGTSYDDTAFGVGGFVMGGLALVWYFGDPVANPDVGAIKRMGIGLTNDYGYTFGPKLQFSELRPEDGNESGPDANLGEVDLSGFTWRIGVTLRYRF